MHSFLVFLHFPHETLPVPLLTMSVSVVVHVSMTPPSYEPLQKLCRPRSHRPHLLHPCSASATTTSTETPGAPGSGSTLRPRIRCAPSLGDLPNVVLGHSLHWCGNFPVWSLSVLLPSSTQSLDGTGGVLSLHHLRYRYQGPLGLDCRLRG